ncbi:MAG: hypothetical protein HZA50_13915 [Planctomycetes bacterium]|nr:hypothetical protein [Planctomycetota bacterium]
MPETTEHLTLAEAARSLPRSVSPNCVWRWCRKGVKSRSGGRVNLEHVRIGGVIYTKLAWLEEFGRRLAQADAEHFSQPEIEQPSTGRRKTVSQSRRQERLAQVERELTEAGI